jgi:hypothetical protein
MITEGVRDLFQRVDTPPERIPTVVASATAPPSTQFFQPAATGSTVLREQAATRRTEIGEVQVHDRDLGAGHLDELAVLVAICC